MVDDEIILDLYEQIRTNIDCIKNKFELDVGDLRDIEDDDLRDYAYNLLWIFNEKLRQTIERLSDVEELTRHVL